MIQSFDESASPVITLLEVDLLIYSSKPRFQDVPECVSEVAYGMASDIAFRSKALLGNQEHLDSAE